MIMKRGFSFVLVMILSMGAYAQDTIFVKGSEWVDRSMANAYALATKQDGGLTKVDRFTLDHVLLGRTFYSKYGKKSQKRIKEGKSIFFYPNGQDSLVLNYADNRLVGSRVAYYPDGQTMMEVNYVDGKREGKLHTYYPSGCLEREECYERGTWKSGKLFAEDGSVLPYTPYERLPEFPGGVSELQSVIRKFLIYPEDARRKRLQGRVLIEFVIDRDGRMVHPKVAKPTHSCFCEPALKLFEAISLIYTWTPGIQNGKPVRVKYTIPISYRLRK